MYGPFQINSEGAALVSVGGNRGGECVFAKVDACRWYDLARFTWSLDAYGYAYTAITVGEHQRVMFHMHRYILGAKENECVDHRSNDKLDNRGSQLRIVDASQNAQNRSKSTTPNSRSVYTGVSTRDGLKCFSACIRKEGKEHHLGYYPTAEIAACAYDHAARQLYGEGARVNGVLLPVNWQWNGATFRLVDVNAPVKLVGVAFEKRTKKYTANLHKKDGCLHLGRYATEALAAQAWNAAARQLRGPDAHQHPVDADPNYVWDAERMRLRARPSADMLPESSSTGARSQRKRKRDKEEHVENV